MFKTLTRVIFIPIVGTYVDKYVFRTLMSKRFTSHCSNINLILTLIDALIDFSFLLFHLIFAAFITFSESARVKAQIKVI